MNKQIIEVYDFTKNNITVQVEIDHENNKISLLESFYDKFYHKADARYQEVAKYVKGFFKIAIRDYANRFNISLQANESTSQ